MRIYVLSDRTLWHHDCLRESHPETPIAEMGVEEVLTFMPQGAKCAGCGPEAAATT